MSKIILIIDDSEDIRENTNELLTLAGYQIITASNGREGLELMHKQKPDLIICDIMMPELDGYGVLRALDNIPELAGTPFIYLTAKADKKDFRKGMDLGADDYLIKPFSGDELLRVVAARLKKYNLQRQNFQNNLEGLNHFISVAKDHGDLNLLSDQRKIKKFRKKDMIYMEGDSPNYIYFVVAGKVKIFKSNEWGKELIIDIKKEGDFFGYLDLLEDHKHSEFAVAIEDTEVALIPAEEFSQLLFTHSEISRAFIKFISNSLFEAEEKLLQLAYNSARKRVAEALLFISEKYRSEGSDALTFNLNRENISSLAGVSAESVSRNITDFRTEGLIDTNEGTIKILHLTKLQNLKN